MTGIAVLTAGGDAPGMLDGSGPADSGSTVERGFPLPLWLLIAALALLVIEFLLYHRRKAG